MQSTCITAMSDHAHATEFVPDPNLPPGMLAGRRALVVDDSSSACSILRRILEREGMSVEVAGDGEQAVECVRSDAIGFDLIMIDLVMENMDGFEAIRQIRQLPSGRTSSICAMTATVTSEVERRCREAGAGPDILRKPYNGSIVRAVAAKALGHAVEPAVPMAASPPAVDSPLDGYRAGIGRDADLQGALLRCCGDTRLLRRMLETLGSDGFVRINAMHESLLRRDLPHVLRQMHNLRGELLNLGMPGLAARLLRLEQSLADLGTGAVPEIARAGLVPDAAALESAHKRLTHIGLDLVKATTELCAQLALQPDAGSTGGETREMLDPQAFATLVAAMAMQDAEALQLTARDCRLLPAHYPPEIEHAFQQRVQALDYPAALQLLDPADRPHDSAHVARPGRRILVVDSMPSSIQLLCGILHTMGWLRFALSGEDAIEIAREWAPSLVLAEIQMEPMSGLTLCRHLKELPQTAHSAIILLSADNDVANEVSALSAGAVDFIEKPLNPARVVGRVNTQLVNLQRMAGPPGGLSSDIRNAPIGFLTCTLSGHIAEMNPSVANLLGRPVRTFQGQDLRQLFEPASAVLVDAALDELAKSGRPASFEARLNGPDAQPIPARLVGWVAPSATGRVLWIAIEDIRDRRQAERRRLDKNLSGLIATITAGIAHEFNNLLGIVIGNLDLVSESKVDPSQRGRLDAAAVAAERAIEISRRLGDSARREATSPRELRRLDAVIDELWPVISNSAPKDMLVVRESDNTESPVMLESRSFRDALMSLLQNAYDAMPAGGRVVVGVRSETRAPAQPGGAPQTTAVVEVRDDGQGMSPEVAERAFDPFFTTRSPARVGLGLSIVDSFVKAHGGTADIRSDPRDGTVVTLRLPTTPV